MCPTCRVVVVYVEHLYRHLCVEVHALEHLAVAAVAQLAQQARLKVTPADLPELIIRHLGGGVQGLEREGSGFKGTAGQGSGFKGAATMGSGFKGAAGGKNKEQQSGLLLIQVQIASASLPEHVN